MLGPLDSLRDTRREWDINRARLIAALLVVVTLLLVLIYRYYSLQISQHEAFLTQSDRNRIRVEVVRNFITTFQSISVNMARVFQRPKRRRRIRATH